MTIIGSQGFSNKSVSLVKPGWTIAGGVVSFQTGRSSSEVAFRTNSSSSGPHIFTVPSPSNTIVVGAAFGLTTSIWGSTVNWFFRIGNDAGGYHLALTTSASGQLQLRLGTAAGTVIATSTNTLQTTGYVHVEMKAVIADSGGTCEVRVNGSTTPWISFTGDTRNAGTTANVPTVEAGSCSGQDTMSIVVDSSTFNGDLTIESRVPTAAGAVTQLTPSTGSNWQNVDEQPAVITDYNGSATVGQRDTYAMADLVATGGTVLSVETLVYAHKSDTGTAAIKTIQRTSGGTERLSGSQAIATSIGVYTSGLQLTDPASAAWTVSSVNSLECGAEVA